MTDLTDPKIILTIQKPRATPPKCMGCPELGLCRVKDHKGKDLGFVCTSCRDEIFLIRRSKRAALLETGEVSKHPRFTRQIGPPGLSAAQAMKETTNSKIRVSYSCAGNKYFTKKRRYAFNEPTVELDPNL